MLIAGNDVINLHVQTTKVNFKCDVNYEVKFSESKLPLPNRPSNAKLVKVTYFRN